MADAESEEVAMETDVTPDVLAAEGYELVLPSGMILFLVSAPCQVLQRNCPIFLGELTYRQNT